jgi:hypothetical protein
MYAAIATQTLISWHSSDAASVFKAATSLSSLVRDALCLLGVRLVDCIVGDYHDASTKMMLIASRESDKLCSQLDKTEKGHEAKQRGQE